MAVKDVEITVAPGEFFSLLGPSGCGKTTLLRMIAGFESPTSGTILVSGKDMSGVPPHRRPVNMVFQNYALFPHLSVFENVAFGLRSMKSLSQAEIRQRVEESLDLVRLKHLQSRLPSQLSGGQQQRVALARAAVNRPAVLLLDEPLSALDLKIRQEMQEELSRLQKQLKITFVMVTHDQGEALALSDRIAVFYNGNLEQLGTPEQIFELPRTAFVADFIGHTNLLEAVVQERKPPFISVLAHGNFKLWIKDNPEVNAPTGSTVMVWIRTQCLKLKSCLPESSNDNDCSNTPAIAGQEPLNCFEAEILSRSYQGTCTDYRLKLSEDLILRASLSNGDQQLFVPGQRVKVCLPAMLASILPGTDVDSRTLVEVK